MEQAIEQFERYIQSRYPNSTTAKNYGYDLRLFSRWIGKPARAVSRQDVDRFVEAQLALGRAATTVNRRLAALHEFFEYLAEEGQEAEWPNPVNWKRQRVKPGKRLPRDASERDVERLMAQVKRPRDRAMFRLMLDVGLRVGEVAGLRKGDLIAGQDGSLGRLRVRGKGDKERFVWLAAETSSVVQAWLAQRPDVGDEAMFITRRKKGFSERGIQERLAHYCRLAGVQVSAHQLRHTFGRRMAEAQMPVTSLAALMGHTQVTTTQIYIAGAGVEVQADYQAAIERLRAARQEDTSAPDEGAGSLALAAETEDVWTLAGVDRAVSTSRQPATRPDMDLSRYWVGLPDWLSDLLQAHITYRQRRWKPSQVAKHTRKRLSSLRQVWRWLLDEGQVSSIAQLRGSHIKAYVEARLAAGMSSGAVNAELSDLWSFLNYLEEQDQPVNASVFRVKRAKEADPVPRFLSENDWRQLESTLGQATQAGQRDDLLDRVWFYLLSEAGLRLSEACDLRLGDVDLAAQRLTVRQGKELRDRCVPLSPSLLQALKAYLPLRGTAQTDHLLIYQQQAVNDSLIRIRLQRYGQQAQVEVSPHRLRHTLATRLLNGGMPITSLQRLLGHDKLETTLRYARVHNETVRQDYERAQARLSPSLEGESPSVLTETEAPRLIDAKANFA
jgi:site-specific recombinase XerD